MLCRLIGAVERDKENKCMSITPGLLSFSKDMTLIIDEIEKGKDDIVQTIASLTRNNGDVTITKAGIHSHIRNDISIGKPPKKCKNLTLFVYILYFSCNGKLHRNRGDRASRINQ